MSVGLAGIHNTSLVPFGRYRLGVVAILTFHKTFGCTACGCLMSHIMANSTKTLAIIITALTGVFLFASGCAGSLGNNLSREGMLITYNTLTSAVPGMSVCLAGIHNASLMALGWYRLRVIAVFTFHKTFGSAQCGFHVSHIMANGANTLTVIITALTGVFLFASGCAGSLGNNLSREGMLITYNTLTSAVPGMSVGLAGIHNTSLVPFGRYRLGVVAILTFHKTFGCTACGCLMSHIMANSTKTLAIIITALTGVFLFASGCAGSLGNNLSREGMLITYNTLTSAVPGMSVCLAGIHNASLMALGWYRLRVIAVFTFHKTFGSAQCGFHVSHIMANGANTLTVIITALTGIFFFTSGGAGPLGNDLSCESMF